MNDTERGFRRIFWGLFLVILDFRINGFDILPDFLGFALIAMGLGLLVPLDRRFLTARVLAVLLIVLSLATLLQHTDAAEADAWPTAWALFEVVYDVLDLAMIWLLCGGIIAVAGERGLRDLADRASFRRMLYVGLAMLGWVVALLARGGMPKDVLVVLVIGLAVLALVVTFLLMGLMLRAARALGAETEVLPPLAGE